MASSFVERNRGDHRVLDEVNCRAPDPSQPTNVPIGQVIPKVSQKVKRDGEKPPGTVGKTFHEHVLIET